MKVKLEQHLGFLYLLAKNMVLEVH
jgi:hypothetical protein